MANPSLKRTRSRRRTFGWVVQGGLGLATYLIVVSAIYIFGVVVKDGAPVLFQKEAPFVNVDFLTKNPETLVQFEDRDGKIRRLDQSELVAKKEANPAFVAENKQTFSYAGGGVAGPIVGTVLLVGLAIAIALGVGISTAIYLHEYNPRGRFAAAVRLAVLNLAGVPSIVYGLFGFAFFCAVPWFPVLTTEPDLTRSIVKIPIPGGFLSFEGWGNSLLAGGLTLALMALPVIVTAAEEALKAIPQGFRETSLALGATRWQMIRTAVLPYALPGILTASILAITRVAGETAPIMFTAAVADKSGLPWQEARGEHVFWFTDTLLQSVQALPYHIYTVSGRVPDHPAVHEMRYGSVFVFLVLISALSFLSIVVRAYHRRQPKW